MFESGKWLVICDRCGFRRNNDQVVKTWDNWYVCAPSTGKTCFETRHPQDFVRSKSDNQTVPYVRSERADQYRSDLPSVNCDIYEQAWVLNPVDVDVAVYKGLVRGPLTIAAGVTMTIHCSLEIR